MWLTVRIISLGAVALLLTVVPADCQPSKAVLCGVKLRDSVSRLKESVEQRFGKTVSCETDRILSENGDYAKAGFAPDGTPTIILDSQEGVDETEIAHELFHLELIGDGLFDRQLITTLPSDINAKEFEFIAGKLRSSIAHRMFYPKMVRMGFEPAGKDRAKWESHVGRNDFRDRLVPATTALVNYVGAATEELPPSLLSKVDLFYQRNGFDQVLKRGKEISAVILNSKPKSATEVASEIISCLEIYYGRKFSASVVTMTRQADKR